MKKFLKGLILILLILVGWYIACKAGIWNEYVLPSPGKVWQTFLEMLKTKTLFADISVSLIRVMEGYFTALILALILGFVAFLFPKAEDYYAPILNFMRNVPPIALIALLILWFGIGEAPKIIVIVLASFFPMFLNISHGFTACDSHLLEVGKSLGFSKRKLFYKIIFPAALPEIFVGMRIGLGYSWRAIIAAEMIAASTGLGHMIVYAQQLSRTDKVLIGVFMIGLIGVICDKLFLILIKKMNRGGSVNDTI